MDNSTSTDRFKTAKGFPEQVKLALENYKSPSVLAEQSPLAKPYFLSHLNRDNSRHASIDWGTCLVEALDQAAQHLYGGPIPDQSHLLVKAVESEELESGRGRRYDYFLLELNYFRRTYRPHPRNQADIYNDILFISRATYYRHLTAAVERLAEALLSVVQPALRLESPFLPLPIVGRDRLRDQILEHLHQRWTVSLIGPSGIGKTTLGAYLRVGWSNQLVFWFTLQPGLNDNIHSLLFALGHFLHQAGQSTLWQQIIADSGKAIDLNFAFGLALSDLNELEELPLLCFDEVDLLHVTDLDRESQAHANIKAFLTRLRREVPVLLIGQRAVVEGDGLFELDALPLSEMEDWLEQTGVQFALPDVGRLQSYTRGNPRLIALCISLNKLQQTTLVETIDTLPTSAGFSPVWDRIRRYLSPLDRRLLAGLAVFRRPAPEDAFDERLASGQVLNKEGSERLEPAPESSSMTTQVSKNGGAFDFLFQQNLVFRDGAGGVYLLPMLRDILYQELAVEQREILHSDAAVMYFMRGEITEAAYHLWKADQPETAVEVWFPIRRKEVERGNGAAALTIFNEISANRLSKKWRDKLFFIRGWLNNRLGSPHNALSEFEKIDDQDDPDVALEIHQLWGDALINVGRREEGSDRYSTGIDRLSELIEKEVLLYYSRGMNARHERDITLARRNAFLAQYYAALLQGGIEDDLGHLDAALTHYQKALALAEQSDEPKHVGRVQYNLGIVFAKLERYEEAFDHFQASIKLFVKVKNKIQEMFARSNYGSTLALAGHYQEGIEESKKALAFYEKTHSSYWIALNATTLADTYFDMGNLEDAAFFARKVIEQEEMQFYPYGLYTMGAVKDAQGDRSMAKDLFSQSVKVAESNADRYMLAYAERAFGEVCFKLGEMLEGERALQNAMRLFQKMAIQSEIEKTKAIQTRFIQE